MGATPVSVNPVKESVILKFGAPFAAFIWYLGLFPGRIGFDSVQAIQLIRKGESTDWWTGLYFWVLKLFTFNGHSIWLASFVSILTLYSSLKFFIFSIPASKKVLKKVFIIVVLSPLFGNFAVNISHDVYFSSGILILMGISFRNFFAPKSRINKFIPLAATLCLMNSKIGWLVIVIFAIALCFQKQFQTTVLIICASITVFLISGIGISKDSKDMAILPFVADLKCVAQHPQARITQDEWEYLSTMAEPEVWKKPISCSTMDEAIHNLYNPKFDSVHKIEFIGNYLSIASKNPAIVIQAHLQRSSEALPPPFFQGIANLVDRDIRNPVGLNTNIALQLGPEVLHPSIDDPKLTNEINVLKPLQNLLLFFSFLINQASWFWGWGGLWLWPILLVMVRILRISKLRSMFALIYPIVVNHLLLVLVGPIPVPRYVMSTILVGFTLSIVFLLTWFENQKEIR